MGKKINFKRPERPAVDWANKGFKTMARNPILKDLKHALSADRQAEIERERLAKMKAQLDGAVDIKERLKVKK